MIQKMSHATIYVLDQNQAKDFYVNKLGFEIKVDHSMPNGFRWLTVAPKGQGDLELILMKVGSGTDFVKMKGGLSRVRKERRRSHGRSFEERMVQRRRLPYRGLP
jgi:catechol 2,3-dioxygenase-like lactoylglutathione lyase family enzyme